MSAPDPLFERLQRAVAPDYRVERELAGGGMGRVYLAHDVVLNQPVAIKVLRPELVTVAGSDSFLREAQMLGSIRHPNVIVIHQARSRHGLQYYIMEFVSGPTLENRLLSDPLPEDDVVRLGTDLLDGLSVVHRLGLVHRDIKPSNIFLLTDRALLGDFGIARPPSKAGDSHNQDGTPDYMAPEQVTGKAITPRTDIYSMGVVLYEATTGRRFHEQGTHVDWSHVPPALESVLRRAVEREPEDRWPDVGSFRRALREVVERPEPSGQVPPTREALPQKPDAPIWRWVAAVVAMGGIAVVVWWVWPRPPLTDPGALEVAFDGIDYIGPSESRFVADTLLRAVRSDLSGQTDFRPAPLPGFLPRHRPSLVVQARMTSIGKDLQLQLLGDVPPKEFRVPLEQWPVLRDSVTYHILLGIWDRRSPLAEWLPVNALPRSPPGLENFIDGERLVGEAHWVSAHDAYLKAEAADASCLLCSWRITDIERWLSIPPDPSRVRRYRDHIDVFPAWYQSLIRADQIPQRPRLDTLRAVTERWDRFFLGWFQYGDELFHRGPLAGRGRAEAILPLQVTLEKQPRFAPAAEHLAWVATAEGDSTAAAGALATLSSLDSLSGKPDAYSTVLRLLLQVGFAWHFHPEQEALRETKDALNTPEAQQSPELGAGPRFLPTFGVPRGAIALGGMMATRPSRDLQRSGLIAQTLGSVALGRLDDARSFASRLTEVSPESEIRLFAAELQAALALLDEPAGSIPEVQQGLRPWIASRGTPVALRERAVWMSRLLGSRVPLRDTTPLELRLLLRADSLADGGQPTAALAILDAIEIDTAARRDPFFRAIVHFQRAGWRARSGDREGAKGELLWAEHDDVVGLLTGLPQAAEVDWALGTLAAWRRAALHAADGERAEACRSYREVVRLWSDGDPPYRARADTARRQLAALHCEGSSPR